MTTDFIKGPSGYAKGELLQDGSSYKEEASVDKAHDVVGAADPRRVFVVSGRDDDNRSALHDLLRALGLTPMQFESLVGQTGSAAPHISEVLDHAFARAQAVVVLLTPDEETTLRSHLHKDSDDESLRLQPRPNVIFEGGMALASHPTRTVLLQIGDMDEFRGIAGRHRVMFDGGAKSRNRVAQRLKNAGCEVDTSGEEWLEAGAFVPR